MPNFLHHTRRIFATMAAAGLLLLSACESKYNDNTDTRILRFTFGAAANAPGIESVSFTIDNDNNLIFNEDSAAYGSNLTRLYPSITYYEKPYSIAVDGEVWNETDSLDFSYPRILTIVSGDGKNTDEYTVKVLKHKVDPDKFVWKRHSDLPLDFAPKGFKALAGENLILVVKKVDGARVMSTADGDNWTTVADIATTVDVTTATLSNDTVYMTTTSRDALLYVTLDGQQGTYSTGSWEVCDIYGILNGKPCIFAYEGDTPVMLALTDGSLQAIELTDALPTGMPYTGASKVTIDGRVIVIGGSVRNAEEYSGEVFSANGVGDYWAKTNSNSTSLTIGKRAWAAATCYFGKIYLFGGTRLWDSSPANTINYSVDQGFSWDTSTTMGLPDDYLSRKLHGAVTWNKSIWLIGGLDKNLSWNSDVREGRINRADFIKQ
ncbi:MAG: hypothetical protein J5808_00585 [Paludibacteraceae bacterium]|nr:hypothetical protein [Paludibacteraceae bacterium]